MPISNLAATSALQTLQNINKQLETTTQRISTGNRINSAKDNATYWSVAVTAQSDVGGMEAVKTSLDYASGYLSVAVSGIELAREKLQEARDVLVTANNAGADFDLIDSQTRALIDDALAAVNGSEFNGTNLLTLDSASTTSVSFVVALENGSGAPATMSIATSGLTMVNATTAGQLNPVTDAYATGGSVASINTAALANTAIGVIDTAIDNLLSAEGTLGASLTRVESQQTFNQALIDAKSQAISDLLSADMEAESTRLQALQTQQALAIEALAIANNQTSSILALFR
ncbi:flagellin N-terminal helical domain-containing protein [Acuticoccus mangrovi]|uniref:Flagellin n=1 Tax=Acuticoccus mangrovi TaxID=2796142 RepID=A0A934MM04_9HYPH|nr:flagellin [Acuticoccus mangrovi]MBJ3776834.1 hypothetical protein [Acuticoccus mangrovi]